MNIRAERLNRGMSTRSAALAIGIARQTLEDLETGDRTPHPATAKKIADFYGVKVTDIWPVDPTPTGRLAA
jgi:DNA-binding XRE family transcriptional regulator